MVRPPNCHGLEASIALLREDVNREFFGDQLSQAFFPVPASFGFAPLYPVYPRGAAPQWALVYIFVRMIGRAFAPHCCSMI